MQKYVRCCLLLHCCFKSAGQRKVLPPIPYVKQNCFLNIISLQEVIMFWCRVRNSFYLTLHSSNYDYEFKGQVAKSQTITKKQPMRQLNGLQSSIVVIDFQRKRLSDRNTYIIGQCHKISINGHFCYMLTQIQTLQENSWNLNLTKT